MEILENHKSRVKYFIHFRVYRLALLRSMALAVESRKASTSSPAPEILSDDRIEDLLKEAETRLRAKAGLEPTPANEDVLALETTDAAPKKRIHFSKLEHNLDRSSYLKNHNGVVKASPDLMVPAEQRKMADGLRAVTRELGDSKKVVSRPTAFKLLPFPQYEEILSQLSLDAHQHLILSLPCSHESLIKFIVTLTCPHTTHLITFCMSSTMLIYPCAERPDRCRLRMVQPPQD